MTKNAAHWRAGRWLAAWMCAGHGLAQVSPCGSGQQLSSGTPVTSGSPVYWSPNYMSASNLSVNMNGNTVTGNANMTLQAGTAICFGPGFRVAGNGSTRFIALVGSSAPSGAYSITTNSLPGGAVGTAYSASLAASGGTPTYAWSVASGSLPPGLGISGATISGTPSTAGSYSFTVQATDALQATAAVALTITVTSPTLTITTTTLPIGTVGTSYSATLTASGGTPTYTWSVVSGPIPPGLTLNAGNGQITGIPSSGGTFPLTVQVTDSLKATASKLLGITIDSSGYNNQNPYWPMTVGSKWTMRSPSSHSVTIITIQPPLSQYGCAPTVQPPSQQAALSPWEIDISKLDPTNYWGHGSPVNLRWFLGVQPPNLPPTGYAGHLYGFGWEVADYSYGVPTANWTSGYINYDVPLQQIPAGLLGPPSGGGNYALDTINVSTTPAYELIQANGAGGSSFAYQYLPDAPSSDFSACQQSNSSSPTWTWDVVWTPNVQVYTPYTGSTSALEASYTETCVANCSFPPTQENWYFADGLGPIRIDQAGTELLELVDFTQGGGSPVSAFVSLRDALVALAGSNCCSSFDTWSAFFTQVANLNAPSSAAVCLNPLAPTTFSVDYYLGLLENIGSPSCTAVSYPVTPNGLNANAMLQQVENMAGTTSGRDYDVWNYFYAAVEGSSGPTPELACMKSVATVDYYQNPNQITVTPNRWMLLTGREWLLFYEYALFGCAS